MVTYARKLLIVILLFAVGVVTILVGAAASTFGYELINLEALKENPQHYLEMEKTVS